MKNDPFRSFAERMMHPDSKWIPEILRSMITAEQAALLLALPGTAEQMAGKLGRPADKVAAELDDMFTKGLAFKKEKGGSVQWRPPMHIAQLHDASILWPRAPESFYTLWQKYMDEEWRYS